MYPHLKKAFQKVFGTQTGAHKAAYVTVDQLERLFAALDPTEKESGEESEPQPD